MDKFGSASVLISISDSDGFRVTHGTDKMTLRHVSADKVRTDAWEKLWQAIDDITNSAESK